MSSERRVLAERITDQAGRSAALGVLAATYQNEKGWITEPASQFGPADLERDDITWFNVWLRGRAVGVLRTLYDPPLEQYSKYDLQLLDTRIDVKRFLKQHRVAEIGRFAILAEHRTNLLLAVALMRAAIDEILARRYSHVITDVFEDDAHTPWASTLASSGLCRLQRTIGASSNATAGVSR
jgi:hypothetical protein